MRSDRRFALVACAVLLPLAGPLLFAQADPAGGLGGAPLAGSLSVRVVEAGGTFPVSGAWVMVGDALDQPFPGNVSTADGNGEATFTDPALTGTVTVTAGAPGRAYVTYLDVPVDEVVLALPPIGAGPTANIGDDFAGIEVGNGLFCSGDGNLDLGFVFPAVPLADVLGSGSVFDIFFSPVNEPLQTPLGDVDVPSNIYAPQQCEIFLNYEKEFYHLDVPVGDRSVYGLTLRGPLQAFLDLANAEDLSPAVLLTLLAQLDFREIDILRDLSITTDLTNVDLSANIALQDDLTIQVANALPTTTVLAAAGGRLSTLAGGEELVITGLNAFDPDTDGSSAALAVTTVDATGSFSDLVPGALVLQLADDDGSGASGSSTHLVRSGITLPTTLVFDSFFELVEPTTVDGIVYQWNDVRSPTSPTVRHVNRSVLARDISLPDPENPGEVLESTETLWQVFSPGARQSLTLPVLPGSAPSSIPEPGATPEDDTLRFSQDVTFLGDFPGAFAYGAFSVADLPSYATHVTTMTVDLPCDAASEITNLRLAKSGTSVSLTWDPSTDSCHAATGPVGYEVWAGADPAPRVAPGSFPSDPAYANVTAEDTDGDTTDPAYAHTPPAGGLTVYLVTDVGETGNRGPVGHYGD